jgi:hypothetical protein
MKRTRRVSAFGLVPAAGLLLCLASAGAAANEPVKETATYRFTGNLFYTADFSQPQPVKCGDAQVMNDYDLRLTTWTWYDAKGQVMRQKQHGETRETWYLDSSPGRTLRGAASYEVETLTPGKALYQGLELWTGVFWHVFGPRGKTVFLDAGLEIIDWRSLQPMVKAVGRHDWLDGRFDALCAALQ